MSVTNKGTDPAGRLVMFACQQHLGNEIRSLESAASAAGYALRVIPLPCSSALEPAMVLRAFEDGADAIQVLACSPSVCRLGDGSRRAAKRMARAGQTLTAVGMGNSRVLFKAGDPVMDTAAALAELIAAADAAGPNPLRKKP